MRAWWRLRPEKPYRFAELAKYNSEVWRGIVHTPEYDEKMRREQALFDADPNHGWETEQG